MKQKLYIILTILFTFTFTTNALASLNISANNITETGDLTINGNATSTLTLGSAATTGNIIIGGAQTTGKVGIGTSTPAYNLDVVGTGKLSTGLITNKIYPASNSTTALQINKADGTTNVLNIDTTNGNVGIGTTSPSEKLHVEGNVQIGSVGNPKTLSLPGDRIGNISAYDGILTFNKTQDTLANGIFWNHSGTTYWATGMDYESTDLFLAWNSGAAGDVIRLSDGGKIVLGKNGTPSNNAANVTVAGATSDATAGAFAVINSTQSGDTGTPFLFYVRNDGKIKMGGADNPTEILDVTGNIKVTSGAFISAGNGTITTPVYTFSNALTTGLVANAGGTNRLGLVVDGGLAMELSSTTINAMSKNLLGFLELGSSGTNARMKADSPASGDWKIRTGSTDNVLVLKSDGNVGIGTTNPVAKLDINSNSFILETAQTPASASAACTTGMISWDASYMYVCTATNTWKRSALTTW